MGNSQSAQTFDQCADELSAVLLAVDEPPQQEQEDSFPRLKGRCPNCGNDTLFRGSKGYITCSWLKCSNPGAATDLLNATADAPERIARLRAAEPDGWQPIETAPKDGTNIMLGWPTMTMSGYWADWAGRKSWVTSRGEYGGSAAPTHWMPLPAPPVLAPATEGEVMRLAPVITRLDSGYWHARWSSEIWAQWPCGRSVEADDFFHSSATPERLKQCAVLAPAKEPARSSQQRTGPIHDAADYIEALRRETEK